MIEERNTEKIEMRYVAKTNATVGGTNNHNNGCAREYSALVDAFHRYMFARKRNTETANGNLEITIFKS